MTIPIEQIALKNTIESLLKRYREDPIEAARMDSLGQMHPDPRLWFYIPHGRWFLGKKDNIPFQGSDSWFQSPDKIINALRRLIEEKKIDLSLVKVGFTKNPKWLHQYYALRERVYRKQLGFESYEGGETSYDRAGKIIVAILDGKVVAGVRVDSSSDHKMMCNDNPEKGFLYKDIIREFDPTFQEGDVYSEICGLAIDKKMGGIFFANFVARVMKYAGKSSRYVVGLSYPDFYQICKVILIRLGYKYRIFCYNDFKTKDSYGVNSLNLKFEPMVIKFR
jgi:hypothetical protein